MATTTYELTDYAGRPLLLYEFYRNSGDVDFFWRYNTSDRDLKYQGNLYKAVPISDSGVRLSSDSSSTDLTVTMPIAEDFCDQFRLSGAVPSDTVWLRIRRAHAGDIAGLGVGADTPVIGDALITWIGTVNGVTQTDQLTASVTCSMLSASFKRGGLRYGYQRNCPHVLYAPNTCKVSAAEFRLAGPVMDVNGVVVQVAAFAEKPDGWLAGGYLEYYVPSGMLERRMILYHTGNVVQLVGLAAGMAVGDMVGAYAGCDLTIDTCVNKFNNLDNYGGFPHTPGRNPFDGNPVF
jgi:uncharacterized protein